MFQAHTDYDPRPDGETDDPHARRLSWSSVTRHKGLVLAGGVAGLALAAAYLAWKPVAYTASSRILVDNRVLSLQQQDAIYSVSSLTSQLMDSQVEILRSEGIARKVIEQLHLLDDPDFRVAASGANAAAAGAQPGDSLEIRRALSIFQKRLSVDRVGQSYVIEIRMTVSDPQRAAAITNSLVTAYLEDQAGANESAAQSASGWLRSRLQSLGTSARVLTKATAPIEKSGPGSLIILGFAALCGMSLGAGGAFARDMLDRRLRSREAVQAACQAECFGALPTMARSRGSLFGSRRKIGNGAQTADGKRVVARADPLDWAIERPRSLFAHTLRRARAAVFAGARSTPIVLGVTSALPGEGKTVAAANIARLAAQWGRKVLLIDAVPYNSQLTKMLAPDAERGLPEILRGTPFTQAVLADRLTEMHFLPGAAQGASEPQADAVTETMERFLAHARSHYDLVVVDLPPLGPVSDVHELAPLLDRVLLVVEWGRCTHDDLAGALAHSGALRRKIIGAVLNKADPSKLRKYASPADAAPTDIYAGYVDDQQRIPAAAPPRRAFQAAARPATAAAAGDHDGHPQKPIIEGIPPRDGASQNA